MLSDKKNIVLLTYITVFGLIIPAIFWFSSRQEQPFLGQKTAPKPSLDPESASDKNLAIQKRISLGDKVLITANNNSHKQAAVKAFASRDYTQAFKLLNYSLQTQKNDPEAWIYLNNSFAAKNGNLIKIGTSVPIGSNLNVAQEILRGIAQAQYEINSNGGVGGKLVQVEIANDDNDPIIAKQIASNFVQDRQILAVVGHNASNASMAAAPIYQQGGLVMISPTSVAKELSTIGEYIFRTTPSTRATTDVLASYAVKSAYETKIAICADSESEASYSFKEEFILAVFDYGGAVSPTICDFSATNFNPADIPSQAIRDGANALLLAPSIDRIHQAVEVAKSNQGRLPLLGNQALYTYETLQRGQVSVNGLVLTAFWHPAIPSNSSYKINTQKLWGGVGNWRTATAYDATKAILEGLNLGLQREILQKALTNSGFSAQGATGNVNFFPSGDRRGKGVLVKIKPSQSSSTGYEFALFQPE
jgi:branched-chain amino acid transport system substrate-binding protein